MLLVQDADDASKIECLPVYFILLLHLSRQEQDSAGVMVFIS